LIKLIVPQAPGSATDVLARVLAAELEVQIGQSIVVENRPGGALTTGLLFTAKSDPDGYTIAMGPIGALAITRHMVKKLPMTSSGFPTDRARDSRPDAAGGEPEASGSHRGGADRPGEGQTRHPGLCLVQRRLAGPRRLRAVQVDDRHRHPARAVPRRVNGDHRPDLRTGARDAGELELDRAFRHVWRCARPGVSGARRSVAFPDLPTIAEAGVAGFEVNTWSGIIGPAAMERPVVDKLNAAINRAVRTPAFNARLGALGQEVAGGTPEEFAETIRRDSAKWLDVIKRSGIKLD
jgi:hypothetical protein